MFMKILLIVITILTLIFMGINMTTRTSPISTTDSRTLNIVATHTKEVDSAPGETPDTFDVSLPYNYQPPYLAYVARTIHLPTYDETEVGLATVDVTDVGITYYQENLDNESNVLRVSFQTNSGSYDLTYRVTVVLLDIAL